MYGLPIVDGPKERIVYQEGDIKGSKMGSPEDCAAARALRRENGVMAVSVFRGRTYVKFKDRVERYVTSSRLRQETISFDRGSPDSFLEGEYKILPPKGNSALGADHRRGRRGGKDKRGVAPPKLRHPVLGARPKAGATYTNRVVR
jgi:hypothetical protein